MLRRQFLTTLAAVVYGAIGLLIAIPGMRFLTAPRRSSRGRSRFIRALPLAALVPDKPLRVTIHADRHDAYMHYPPGPIGSVWLLRKPNETDESDTNGGEVVRCLQTICPHLGCGIDYAVGRQRFTCPCHASDFDLTGAAQTGPSPRGMDELACRISDPDESGRRWIEIQYQEFKTGLARREPLT